jgi:uncharacterized OB-fold protein
MADAAHNRSARGRPLPDLLRPELSPFWEGVAVGELRVTECADCGRLQWPPRPVCAGCLGMEFRWRRVSESGVLHSFVAVSRAFHPSFMEEVPYGIVVVALENGIRMLGRSEGIDPSALRIGMPMRAVFTNVEGVGLVYWRPSKPRSASDKETRRLVREQQRVP